MEKKKPSNKQIIDAYGQSYKIMQKAKRHDDKQPGNAQNLKNTKLKK